MALKETLSEVVQAQGKVIPFHDPHHDWLAEIWELCNDETWGFPPAETAAVEEGVGVQVNRYLHPDSARQLHQWLRDRNIANLTPPDRLHVSMYSSGHTPEKLWNAGHASPIHVLPEHMALLKFLSQGRMQLVLGIYNSHFASRRKKSLPFMGVPTKVAT